MATTRNDERGALAGLAAQHNEGMWRVLLVAMLLVVAHGDVETASVSDMKGHSPSHAAGTACQRGARIPDLIPSNRHLAHTPPAINRARPWVHPV
jgi:hypothetical protein